MSTPRTPGTTNAPGGAWHSASNAARKSPAKRLTLSRPVWVHLEALGPRRASAYVEALIRDAAAAKGTPISSL